MTNTLGYRIVQSDLGKTVFVFLNGVMRDANETNPAFDLIVQKCLDNDANGLIDLFNSEAAVKARFETLTDNISVKGDALYYQGDVMDDVFAEAIVRLIRQGDTSWEPAVKFLDKVHSNTDAHVRENLTRWLKACGDEGGFSIDGDGDIRAYKGLTKAFKSVQAGPGIVNGEEFDKPTNLDNSIGNVVEMPRSKVTVDPSRACASGLHVGVWSYASTFGDHSTTVEVKVDPRNVVSVPHDYSNQKMRVSKYTVIKQVRSPEDTFVVE